MAFSAGAERRVPLNADPSSGENERMEDDEGRGRWWSGFVVGIASALFIVVLSPFADRVGSLLVEKLWPTERSADLRLAIIRHHKDGGPIEAYVTNRGNQESVVEFLETCSANRFRTVARNRTEKSLDGEDRDQRFEIFRRQFEPHFSFMCKDMRDITVLRVIEGDRRVRPGESSLLSFLPPSGVHLIGAEAPLSSAEDLCPLRLQASNSATYQVVACWPWDPKY